MRETLQGAVKFTGQLTACRPDADFFFPFLPLSLFLSMAECAWVHWASNPHNILDWEDKLFALVERKRTSKRQKELRESLGKVRPAYGEKEPYSAPACIL